MEKHFKKPFMGSKRIIIDEDHDFEQKCCDQPMMHTFKKKFNKGMGPHGFAFHTGFNTKPHSNNVIQIIKDNRLHIAIKAPGLDKETIKLRAKSNKITFFGKLKSDISELFGEEEIKINIGLIETVDSVDAKADYTDGMMVISFPVVEEGEEIKF